LQQSLFLLQGAFALFYLSLHLCALALHLLL
jgi:hypothetical protein